MRIDPKQTARVLGSSLGTQPKRYENGYWYKFDQKGYEGLAEYLVSGLVDCSDTDHFVRYELYREGERRGCRSEDFLKGNEEFVSFARLYQLHVGGELSDALLRMSDFKERIAYTRRFVEEATGYDVLAYLQKILALDALTLNTDRHLNNLGVIIDPDSGAVKEAPIFDNGAALLSDFTMFDPYEPLADNMEKAKGKPFYSDLMQQAAAVGFGIHFDYERVEMFLSEQKSHRAIDVLRHQLEKYADIYRADLKK